MILIKIWVPGKLPSQVKREAGENPARSRRCIEEICRINLGRLETSMILSQKTCLYLRNTVALRRIGRC